MVMQEDLNKLCKWSKDWQMRFNVDKCKVMHFRRTNDEFSYFTDGVKLEEVREIKDLGIVVTEDLKPSSPRNQPLSS